MNGPCISQPALIGRPIADGWRDGDMIVSRIDHARASDIIRANHYSGTVCLNSEHHFGVFLGGVLCGVMQWGYAMNPASGGRILPGLAQGEWHELNRMWFDDSAPRCTESRAISLAVRLLKHNNPRLRMLQSFADERCGGLGVVYQACSFGFYGEHVSTFYEIDGTWFHKIAATTSEDTAARKGHKAAAHVRQSLSSAVVHNVRQFRYLRFLNKRDEAACLLPRQPYPKRAQEVA